MGARGKSINLFLMDGKADGRIKCTLANWTGVAYKIPRTDLDLCKEREDLKQSGVYFLFGISDETEDNIVYVGQASERKNGEGILCRLQEHTRNPEKDYWTEAVVFTTTNNSFGPTEISYLENHFCNIALQAKRYEVKNGNEPALGHITEEKECELEEFIEFSKLVMGALGHKVFIPIQGSDNTPGSESEGTVDEQLLHLKHSRVKALGKRTSDGFAVLKGSQVIVEMSPSCSDTVKKLRKRHMDKISDGVLTEDIIFNSPSAAAGFVVYYNINGMTAWVSNDGKTLKDLESSE